MSLGDFEKWMREYTHPEYIWYVKRLSGNDTLANGTHQAGPYIPKEILFKIFPKLDQPDIKNPEVWFDLWIDSHLDQKNVRAVWYNNKLHENPTGGRNEARITNLGGAASALLNPENTGALAIFVFKLNKNGNAIASRVWVCVNSSEEDLVEDRIGPIEPSHWKIWTIDQSAHKELFSQKDKPKVTCWLAPEEIPPTWLEKFPTGAEIIEKTVELRAGNHLGPDERLVNRRDCEFEIFRSVEEAMELPSIRRGFVGIDEFIARAQTILQRRKARSGRSLELHARKIFLEEGLEEDKEFSHQPESEPGKKPDFLFPSSLAYKNKEFPDSMLKMLAVKTTCKDRWRQILNEADRIPVKHLLTLQEGVSERQFREMSEAGVQLVVPKSLIKKFPEKIRQELQTFEKFINMVKK